jgi:hypothetical protein
MFNLKPNTNCIYEAIEYRDDENNIKTVACFDYSHNYRGLVPILKELGLINVEDNTKRKLEELRKILLKCPAFETDTRLDSKAAVCRKNHLVLEVSL